MHKIEVKNKTTDKVSTGANTELYIDGQKAKGVKSFKYEVQANGVGVVTIEYFAHVEIECNVPEIIAKKIILDEQE